MSGKSNRLSGKTVFITAAGRGIGREAARMFALEGATVWATDVDEQALAGLEGCKTVRLDVRNDDMINEVVQAAGPVHILFNCAGIVPNGSILDCSSAEWALTFDLNVTSMYRTIRAVLPGMMNHGGGTVGDTGIGMSREDLHIALQPFGQVDNRLERKYEGTGLGLPLTPRAGGTAWRGQ